MIFIIALQTPPNFSNVVLILKNSLRELGNCGWGCSDKHR